jgi:hypothetical protein
LKAIAHIRRLGPIVRSPWDAWVLARMIGWSLVLPVLKRTLPLPRVVSLLRSNGHADRRDPDRERRLAALSEWVFLARPRRSRDNCLDRALVTYRYLGGAGAEPTIVVGIAKGADNAVAGHVWVTVDGEPVHDDPQTVESFVPVTAFDAQASRSILKQ